MSTQTFKETEGKFTDSSCACKGIRTCLLCEDNKSLEKRLVSLEECFYFCLICKKTTRHSYENHSTIHTTLTVPVNPDGITVIRDFINANEEAELLTMINNFPWVASQSGRLKQDFGPKVNFKKKKLKTDAFKGFPKGAQFLIDKINNISLLKDFYPVELCNLEYSPDRGSAIDPHTDDAWLWGERLITINLESDTNLTLTLPSGVNFKPYKVVIPMPRWSLIILEGEARHLWFHSIRREDIKSRRVAMTFRELSSTFLPGGSQYDEFGKMLLLKSKEYFTVL